MVYISIASEVDDSPYSKKIWPPPPDVGEVNMEAQRLAADAIQRAAYHVHTMCVFIIILLWPVLRMNLFNAV